MKATFFTTVLALGISLLSCSRVENARPFHQKLALLMGGSGEPGANSFLIQDLRNMRLSLLNRGWKVSAVVGAYAGLLPGSYSALNKNIHAQLESLDARLKLGDQALLWIHAHGRERDTKWSQKTHSILTEDVDSSGTSIEYDLDTLEPWVKRWIERGVQVSVIDFSCYSGSLQNLHPSSCNISLAAESYVSICSGRQAERLFTGEFVRLLGSQEIRQIEQLFLTSRLSDRKSINYPQISSKTVSSSEAWSEILKIFDPLDINESIRLLRPTWKAPALTRFFEQLGAESAQIKSVILQMIETRQQIESRISALSQLYEVPGLLHQGMNLSPGWLYEILSLDGVEEDSRVVGWNHQLRRRAAEILAHREDWQKKFAAPLDQVKGLVAELEELRSQYEDLGVFLLSYERDWYVKNAKPTSGKCEEFTL